jgi:hypothetical protein
LVGTINATEKLSFVGNYDYGWQTIAALPSGINGQAVWTGFAGYINYKFNEKWRTSVRGEVFNDRNGFRTGVAQTWDEATLTLGYAPIKVLQFRIETRHDFSNVNSFLNSNGTLVRNNQQSYAVEGIYMF